jgi:hypothetical protein
MDDFLIRWPSILIAVENLDTPFAGFDGPFDQGHGAIKF